jgi:hypothetical protein
MGIWPHYQQAVLFKNGGLTRLLVRVEAKYGSAVSVHGNQA